MKGNFLFLPSSNFLEHEDSFVNIFGDLQFTNQVLDTYEDEVKSDFFIFKKLIFIFFSFFEKESFENVVSFDFLFNEIIFYYLNFFCFVFDSFPLFSNYFFQEFFVE
jgi:anaerobic selenocysteine-containing dehydrogenase